MRSAIRPAVAALAAVGVGVTIWAGRAATTREDCRDLGPVALYPDNSVASWPCIPAFVVHGVGTDFAVYLAVDPLTGGALRWDGRRHLFSSPAGRRTYDPAGRPIGAPGGRPLIRCPVRIVAGHLVVLAAGGSSEEVRRACGWRGPGAEGRSPSVGPLAHVTPVQRSPRRRRRPVSRRPRPSGAPPPWPPPSAAR